MSAAPVGDARAAAMSCSEIIVFRPSVHRSSTSSGLRLEREGVDLHLLVGAERPRDHAALRMLLGLDLGELALADELVHERVVLGQALEGAVAQEVCAAVADVRERDGAVLGRRAPPSPSCPMPDASASVRERS